MAGPLRGGRGGKGPDIKGKKLPFKNKLFHFRQLIEIWTYHDKVCL